MSRVYKKLYAEDFEVAKTRLATIPGVMAWSDHDYEAFTFKADGLSMAFYPHKTSTGNRYIRVRDNGSKNKNKFVNAVALLQKGEHTTRFSCKQVKFAGSAN